MKYASRILIPLLVILTFFSIGCASQKTLIVQISTPFLTGSGFVVAETSDSWIVATAAHCCAQWDNLMSSGIVMAEGEVCPVIARHSTKDVALVRMPKRFAGGHTLRRFKVWSLADAVQGELITAYGYAGITESQIVMYRGWVISTNWRGYVAHNAGIYPGCSGGPVADEQGRAIGLTSQYEDLRGEPDTATILAVPSSAIKELLDEASNKR